MLAGAGLRDNAGLAHSLSQERLADYLVGLVSASVHEVLTLEEDARLSAKFGRFGERRGAAQVVPQVAGKLLAEGRIILGVDEGLLELVECWNE